MAKLSTTGDSSFKSLCWMTVALCCGVGLLLGTGMFMASRVGRALQFRAAGAELTLRTPAGDWRVEKPNEIGPGLPVYPDALLVLPQEYTRPPKLRNNQAEVQTAIYQTSDPPDFVDNWYLKHLGPEFVRNNLADKAILDVLSDARISNNDVTFIGERGDQVRIVAIAPDSTGTNITLVRFTQRKAHQMGETR